MTDTQVEDWQAGGFGLYVHWPFCESKCPYCDFNSHVSTAVDQARWRAAFTTELNRYGELTQGRVLQSIFFGGGTPSLMEPETVAAVIDQATRIWTPANNIEITLEANPGSVEAAKFAGFRAAGVNRVSLGVQALNDGDLRRLGRKHSHNDALRALQIANKEFDRVSFDLIYARQDQTLAQWQEELARALEMATGHLSLYQLTIEDGTVFAERMARGLLHGLPNEDLAADFYELTQQMCEDAFMPAYEISNHARQGQESVHNLLYWRGGDYVGIGPGAHGRLTINAHRYPTEAAKQPGAWLRHVEDSSDTFGDFQSPLSHQDRAIEYFLMGLRITEGVSLDRLASMETTPTLQQQIAELEGLGLMQSKAGMLSMTKSGRPLLNAVLQKLVEAF